MQRRRQLPEVPHAPFRGGRLFRRRFQERVDRMVRFPAGVWLTVRMAEYLGPPGSPAPCMPHALGSRQELLGELGEVLLQSVQNCESRLDKGVFVL